MSKKQSTDLVPIGAPAAEKWESPEEAFAYLKSSMVENMVKFAQFLWEAGQVTVWARSHAEYGDGIVDKMAEMFNRKKTWVYECIKMHETYEWETIVQRFIAAGVPASSIARLACIEDPSTRNYVEDKLVAGDIHYDDITKAKKEFEDRVNDTEHTHDELGDGDIPSMEELKAQQRAGVDSDDSKAATVIRSYFGGLERDIDQLMIKMDDKFFAAIDQLSAIGDDGLYDLSVDRMVSCAMKMKKLKTHLINNIGSIALHRPDDFQEEEE